MLVETPTPEMDVSKRDVKMHCWVAPEPVLGTSRGLQPKTWRAIVQQISAPTQIKHLNLNFIKASAASDQKAAREHTAQTTAEGKLIKAFCACVRGVSCLYQQLSIVYMPHSKGETKTKIYEINTDIRNLNKSALAYHFEYQWRWEFILNYFKRLMLL